MAMAAPFAIPAGLTKTAVLSTSAPTLLASGASAINIDLDLTFTVQVLAFALLIVVLKPLLFEPVLAIFEERERRTDGARSEAREMQEQAGELLRKYEAELQRVSATAAEERDRIRTETTQLEAEILAEARTATTQIIDEGRRQIATQVQQIKTELGRQSDRLGQQIATRALGREVS
jgi:F-type H+-transporting ATPase subunit b